MKFISNERSKLLRQTRNLDMVRRMRAGENLASFNSQESWYPPRPTIEKDPQALERLYGMEKMTMTSMTDDDSARDGLVDFPQKVS